MLTHTGQLFNNSHQCNIQTKRKKTSSLKQVMHISCLLLDTNLDHVVGVTSLVFSPGFKHVSLDN